MLSVLFTMDEDSSLKVRSYSLPPPASLLSAVCCLLSARRSCVASACRDQLVTNILQERLLNSQRPSMACCPLFPPRCIMARTRAYVYSLPPPWIPSAAPLTTSCPCPLPLPFLFLTRVAFIMSAVMSQPLTPNLPLQDQWQRKKQTKAQAAEARRNKLDPDSALNRSAKEVMDEQARKKRKRDQMQDEDDDWSEVEGIEPEKPRQA